MSQKKNGSGSKVVPRRLRRTKVEIERLLFDAATKIIEKSGFPSLTVTGIVQEARVDPPVFYNRYVDLEDFIDTYVRAYDYWLRDSINIDFSSKLPVESLSKLIDELIDSLVNNIPMQKLIAWELNDCNHITKRTAQARDITSMRIIEFFTESLKNCNIKFDYSTALLIGGLYYLIIHRNLGTFNLIDFSKKENISDLKKTLKLIINKIYDDYKIPLDNSFQGNNKKMIEVANELIKSNVEYEIIQRATKLNKKTLDSLYSK